MLRITRTGLAVAAMVITAVVVLVITVMRPERSEPPAPGGLPARAVLGGDVEKLAGSPHLLFRHTGIDEAYNHLSISSLSDPDSARGVAALQCERVSFAAGRGICLEANRGVLTTFEAVLFDRHFNPSDPLKLDGAPSRTRISPDGRIGAITVFVTGQEHGYASVSFSTKTILIEMDGQRVLGDLEKFETWRDGQKFSAKDFNFWGVTFTHDSNVFYATLMTAKKTYLVRGDLAQRRLTVLHENVECPSLSPDDRLIAYKKRVGGNLATWRFYILELATMREQPMESERRSIDDQIEWFDDTHVLYGAPRSSSSAIRDVWMAPVAGNEPARAFLLEAESPIVVR